MADKSTAFGLLMNMYRHNHLNSKAVFLYFYLIFGSVLLISRDSGAFQPLLQRNVFARHTPVQPTFKYQSRDYSAKINPVILRRGQMQAHMGHSHAHHHHHDHSSKEDGVLEWKLPNFRSKRTLARLVLAAMCSIALPLIRRQSSREVAVLCIVSLFLGLVEVGKMMLGQVQVQFSGLHQAWQDHRDLEDMTPDSIKSSADAKESDRVTWLGVWTNIGLSAFKLVAGIVGRSSAMVADAGHSLSDLLSDAVTLWAVRFSRLPPDEDHPYGHGRFEAVGAFLIATMLVAAGYGLGNHSYESLLKAIPQTNIPAFGMGPSVASAVANAPPAVPGKIALVAAVVSIVVKEFMYRITARVGERLNSQVLIANAWHHRSDALSSCIAVLGIGGAFLGLPVLDPLAGLMVAAMLSLTGLQVGWESVKQLTDTADTESTDEIGKLIKEVDGVLGYCNLRARRMGSQMLVDCRIQCDPLISATAAHQIAERTRWHVLREMPFVSDVLITVAGESNPCPVVESLPTQDQIEKSVHDVLRDIPDIKKVTRIMVHYKNMMPSVDVFVQVDDQIQVQEAKVIANDAAAAIEGIKDIKGAELHLDLGLSSGTPANQLPGIIG